MVRQVSWSFLFRYRSGLNNLTVNSVMDEEYDGFFGFTETEVHEMLEYYGASDKEEEIKNWYDVCLITRMGMGESIRRDMKSDDINKLKKTLTLRKRRSF